MLYCARRIIYTCIYKYLLALVYIYVGVGYCTLNRVSERGRATTCAAHAIGLFINERVAGGGGLLLSQRSAAGCAERDCVYRYVGSETINRGWNFLCIRVEL